MLFALSDFFKYRKRRGRYSDQSLTEFGLRRATEAGFPNWKTIPLGSFLFASTANSTLSWIVMYVTNSVLSHVAVVYGDGEVHDVTTNGVIRHPISDYFDGQSYLAIKPPHEGVDFDRMRVFLDSTIGHRFDWVGVIKLAFHIVIANSTSFTWRLAGDLLILFSIAIALAWALLPSLIPPTLGTAAIYLAVVIVNRTVRKKAIEDAFRPISHESRNAP